MSHTEGKTNCEVIELESDESYRMRLTSYLTSHGVILSFIGLELHTATGEELDKIAAPYIGNRLLVVPQKKSYLQSLLDRYAELNKPLDKELKELEENGFRRQDYIVPHPQELFDWYFKPRESNVIFGIDTGKVDSVAVIAEVSLIKDRVIYDSLHKALDTAYKLHFIKPISIDVDTVDVAHIDGIPVTTTTYDPEYALTYREYMDQKK